MPNIKDNPPQEWIKLIGIKLLAQSSNSEEKLKKAIAGYLHKVIGPIDSVFAGMKIELLFKGVTYEMLQDQTLRDLVMDKFYFEGDFFEEFEAARKRN